LGGDLQGPDTADCRHHAVTGSAYPTPTENLKGPDMPTRIAAHRGGALEAPENTLEAFSHALRLGVEEIECDVHLSSDGRIMVHHDATLERMTDGHGPLCDCPAEALRRLRIKGSATARMPVLSEVLALLAPGDVVLRLELKRDACGRLYDGLAATTLAEVDQAGMRARAYVTSFAVDYLRAPEIAESGLARLLLVEAATFRDIGGLDGLARILDLAGTAQAALPIDLLTPGLVAAAQARGMVVSAFGCHTDMQIGSALELGLPVCTTDRPSVALAMRGQAAHASEPANNVG
jgi:glycerophosphoryl diester phosphodiesterase